MLTDIVQDKQTLSCGRVQAGLSNRGMIMINTFINLKTNVVQPYLLIKAFQQLEASLILRRFCEGSSHHIPWTSYLKTDFRYTWHDRPLISSGILNATIFD